MSARAFTPWWLASLALTLGTVEGARALRVLPAASEPSEPPTVALAVPPKPNPSTSSDPHPGDGADADVDPARCDALAGATRDVCLAALARGRAERDPDAGLDACAAIADPTLAAECRADVAEGHARVDPERSRRICGAIEPARWRDQCVFGIAMAWATADPAFALATCEDSGRWRPFCRHDVNGERATVDLEGAVAYCGGLPAERRDTCWHGIGKYVGRIDPDRAITACVRAPAGADLAGQCAHGVGWAVAEARSAGAEAWCEGRGGLRDSCVMGVAYHARRYDPERAAAVCATVGNPSERRHCLDVVRQAR